MVGYTLDSANSELVRNQLSTGLRPGRRDNSFETDRRVVARGTEGFELYWIDPVITNGTQLLGFRLELENVNMTPGMEVRINKL